MLREFIKQREGDRIALVFFGINAYLQAPHTTDFDVIDFMLEETDVGMAGQMTGIGKAIGYSVKIFEGDSLDQKVLMLLTDGMDDEKGILPTDAAKIISTEKNTQRSLFTISYFRITQARSKFRKWKLVQAFLPKTNRKVNR